MQPDFEDLINLEEELKCNFKMVWNMEDCSAAIPFDTFDEAKKSALNTLEGWIKDAFKDPDDPERKITIWELENNLKRIFEYGSVYVMEPNKHGDWEEIWCPTKDELHVLSWGDVKSIVEGAEKKLREEGYSVQSIYHGNV